MGIYSFKDLRNKLTVEDHYSLLKKWGGEPIYTDFGLIAHTICHNEPGHGSAKLYYYNNSKLYICYTEGCGNEGGFDIFELCQKVFKIQKHQEISLMFAVSYVANYFGIAVSDFQSEDLGTDILEDWQILSNYDRLQLKENNNQEFLLAEYDN